MLEPTQPATVNSNVSSHNHPENEGIRSLHSDIIDDEVYEEDDDEIENFCGVTKSSLISVLKKDVVIGILAIIIACVGWIVESACRYTSCADDTFLGATWENWLYFTSFCVAITIPCRIIDRVIFFAIGTLNSISSDVLNTVIFYLSSLQGSISRFLTLAVITASHSSLIQLNDPVHMQRFLLSFLCFQVLAVAKLILVRLTLRTVLLTSFSSKIHDVLLGSLSVLFLSKPIQLDENGHVIMARDRWQKELLNIYHNSNFKVKLDYVSKLRFRIYSHKGPKAGKLITVSKAENIAPYAKSAFKNIVNLPQSALGEIDIYDAKGEQIIEGVPAYSGPRELSMGRGGASVKWGPDSHADGRGRSFFRERGLSYDGNSQGEMRSSSANSSSGGGILKRREGSSSETSKVKRFTNWVGDALSGSSGMASPILRSLSMRRGSRGQSLGPEVLSIPDIVNEEAASGSLKIGRKESSDEKDTPSASSPVGRVHEILMDGHRTPMTPLVSRGTSSRNVANATAAPTAGSSQRSLAGSGTGRSGYDLTPLIPPGSTSAAPPASSGPNSCGSNAGTVSPTLSTSTTLVSTSATALGSAYAPTSYLPGNARSRALTSSTFSRTPAVMPAMTPALPSQGSSAGVGSLSGSVPPLELTVAATGESATSSTVGASENKDHLALDMGSPPVVPNKSTHAEPITVSSILSKSTTTNTVPKAPVHERNPSVFSDSTSVIAYSETDLAPISVPPSSAPATPVAGSSEAPAPVNVTIPPSIPISNSEGDLVSAAAAAAAAAASDPTKSGSSSTHNSMSRTLGRQAAKAFGESIRMLRDSSALTLNALHLNSFHSTRSGSAAPATSAGSNSNINTIGSSNSAGHKRLGETLGLGFHPPLTLNSIKSQNILSLGRASSHMKGMKEALLTSIKEGLNIQTYEDDPVLHPGAHGTHPHGYTMGSLNQANAVGAPSGPGPGKLPTSLSAGALPSLAYGSMHRKKEKEYPKLTPGHFAAVAHNKTEINIDQMFMLFDLNSDNLVSRDEFITACEHVWAEIRALKLSLNGHQSVITALTKLMDVVFVVLLSIFILVIFDVSISQVYVPLGTFLVSMSFAIGSSVSQVVSSMIFVIITRPYDVGDRVTASCVFDGTETLIVKQIDVLTTTFLKNVNKEITVPNWILFTSNIENFRRSPPAVMKFEFFVNLATSAEQLEYLRLRINAYLETQTLSWKPVCAIRMNAIKDQSMGLCVWATSLLSWQDAPRLFKANFQLWMVILQALRDLGITFRAPPQSLQIEGNINIPNFPFPQSFNNSSQKYGYEGGGGSGSAAFYNSSHNTYNSNKYEGQVGEMHSTLSSAVPFGSADSLNSHSFFQANSAMGKNPNYVTKDHTANEADASFFNNFPSKTNSGSSGKHVTMAPVDFSTSTSSSNRIVSSTATSSSAIGAYAGLASNASSGSLHDVEAAAVNSNPLTRSTPASSHFTHPLATAHKPEGQRQNGSGHYPTFALNPTSNLLESNLRRRSPVDALTPTPESDESPFTSATPSVASSVPFSVSGTPPPAGTKRNDLTTSPR